MNLGTATDLQEKMSTISIEPYESCGTWIDAKKYGLIRVDYLDFINGF